MSADHFFGISYYIFSEFRRKDYLNFKFSVCYTATRDEERMELEIIAEENERNSEGGVEEDEEMIEEGEDELVILDPSHVRHSRTLKIKKKRLC